MRRMLRWIAIGLAGLVAAGFAVAGVARLSDGPIGPFVGGPLVAGELAPETRPDWAFASGLTSIELEANPAAPRSRTTWVLVVAGDLYVPCGLPASKTWPHQVLLDGRVVLRIEGRRYERLAVKETDPARLRALAAEVARKYGVGDEASALAGEDVWFFRIDPRPAA